MRARVVNDPDGWRTFEVEYSGRDHKRYLEILEQPVEGRTFTGLLGAGQEGRIATLVEYVLPRLNQSDRSALQPYLAEWQTPRADGSSPLLGLKLRILTNRGWGFKLGGLRIGRENSSRLELTDSAEARRRFG